MYFVQTGLVKQQDFDQRRALPNLYDIRHDPSQTRWVQYSDQSQLVQMHKEAQEDCDPVEYLDAWKVVDQYCGSVS